MTDSNNPNMHNAPNVPNSPDATNAPILSVKHLSKTFRKESGHELLVLDDIDFTLEENEIIALLGKSGSGKSTLLRIIAGLIPPTLGAAHYYDRPIHAPLPGISLIFQSSALLPWLTVLQNVELGLEALGIARDERRQRALHAIDTIGLDGFESAFPKELSGGMRQRVGFARALVVNPTLLLMDEPFSALDVLTAENLRTDLIDLWHSKKTNTKGILFVTHNIEEAVKVADRIFVFSGDPGNIKARLKVDLPFPRTEQNPAFRKLVDKIYTVMTSTEFVSATKRGGKARKVDLWYRLPDVAISELLGMLETLHAPENGGHMDLPELAEIVHMNIDDLLVITEILELLDFVEISGGDIRLREAGKRIASVELLEQKQLFAAKLIPNIPLIRYIRQVLDHAVNARAQEQEFLSILESALSDTEAQRVLKVAIDWGRYAEIFAYDATTGTLNLENPT